MRPSTEPPGAPPAGYPPQDYSSQPPPLQPTAYGQQPPFPQQQMYGQQGYGQQQPFFQQAYAQPNIAQPYAYPPMAAQPPMGYSQQAYASHNPQQPSPYVAKPEYQGFYDEEAGRMSQAASFADKTARQGFIRKVFAILSVMMAVTVAVVCLFMFEKNIQRYMRANSWPFWSAFAISFGVLIYLSCSPNGARKYPTNMIFLMLFTLCQSILIGTVTMFSAPDAVLIAAACTLGITLALTLFATQTKFDFTTIGGVLVGALVVLIICSLIGIFIRVKWFHIVIAGVGALLFCVFLVYDVQLIMGEGRYAMSPDDYVFGALALYIDIINIFLYILTIIGLVKDD